MRILIDLQACQTAGSRQRGIGRYSMAHVKAMVKNAGSHDLHLMLHAQQPDAIENIRNEFSDLLPHQNIHTWHSAPTINTFGNSCEWRRQTGEIIKEQAFYELKPDFIHVASLFEGLGDNAITSVHRTNQLVPTSAILYDLIPLVHKEHYLNNITVNQWYYKKLQDLKNADLLLAISNASRNEAINYLQLASDQVVNISSAVDERFYTERHTPEQINQVLHRYGLHKNIVMYTGGIDLRKNIDLLITAYSKLPEEIRTQHQLAIVCSVQEQEKNRLLELAKKSGLSNGEVILTGFVTDEDLQALYQACTLFVFPSWHEGFGLPALEAMASGAAVIAANTSSLPEVLGREDALFNPFVETDITAKIFQGLHDQAFRRSLQEHSFNQAKKFSWDVSAIRTIEAFEQVHKRNTEQLKPRVFYQAAATKPKLAYVSPLPPLKTGIADYSAELLPELARHYDIVLISDQDCEQTSGVDRDEEISAPWLAANFTHHTVSWFAQNASQFDRIVYHFGNSLFHAEMFFLLQKHPGIVVLHDFFLSNIVSHLDTSLFAPHSWVKYLYQSHGLTALYDNQHVKNVHDVIWKYPANLPVINKALGLIVHSQYSQSLAKQWYGDISAKIWETIPLIRCLPTPFDQLSAKKKLGLQESDFLICAFGMLGPTKLNHCLIQAWLNSNLAKDQTVHLVFVGENEAGQYGKDLINVIDQANCDQRIKITGFAAPELFRTYLQAADGAVQLRTKSRGETSGAVLDCMAHGIPTIINANGSMQELPRDALIVLDDAFTEQQLIQSLLQLLQLVQLKENHQNQQNLQQLARTYIQDKHHPFKIGNEYAHSIENIYALSPDCQRQSILQQIAEIEPENTIEAQDYISVAKSISANFMAGNNEARLLVDVSILANCDVKSGIQRVVRAILFNLIKAKIFKGRVEPVVMTQEGLRYARKFSAQLFQFPTIDLADDLVEFSNGDIFLGLDLNHEGVVKCENLLNVMRNQGVRLYFVVYDLLPLLQPHFFSDGLVVAFHRYMQTMVNHAHGAICISNAVKQELRQWVNDNRQPQLHEFAIEHFHLGADLEASVPLEGEHHFKQELETSLKEQTCFLMVGTVEPRKAYEQALKAFEVLWEKNQQVCLIMVGGQGWKTEALVQKIEQHSEYNSRLFWLKQTNDQMLEKLYQQCHCLLMASFGEGFGLPLIEAARHHLPIVARRLPVFEEIIGRHADYFEGDHLALAEKLSAWLTFYKLKQVPDSSKIAWLSWEESTKQLCNTLLTFISEQDKQKTKSTTKL